MSILELYELAKTLKCEKSEVLIAHVNNPIPTPVVEIRLGKKGGPIELN